MAKSKSKKTVVVITPPVRNAPKGANKKKKKSRNASSTQMINALTARDQATVMNAIPQGHMYHSLTGRQHKKGVRYEAFETVQDTALYLLSLAVPELHLPVKIPDGRNVETGLNTMEFEIPVPIIADSGVAADSYAGIAFQNGATARYQLLTAAASGALTWGSLQTLPAADLAYFTTNANAMRLVSSSQHFMDQAPMLYRQGETGALRVVQSGAGFSGNSQVPSTWSKFTSTEGNCVIPNSEVGGANRRLTYIPAVIDNQPLGSPAAASPIDGCSQIYLWKGATASTPVGSAFTARVFDNWESQIFEDLQNVNNTSIDAGDVGDLTRKFNTLFEWLGKIGTTYEGVRDFLSDQRFQYFLSQMSAVGNYVSGKLFSAGAGAALAMPLRSMLIWSQCPTLLSDLSPSARSHLQALASEIAGMPGAQQFILKGLSSESGVDDDDEKWNPVLRPQSETSFTSLRPAAIPLPLRRVTQQ